MSGENRHVDTPRIDEILRVLRRVSGGDYTERLPLPDGDGPMAQLVDGINQTIEALAVSRQKEDAARERLFEREAFLREGERIGELGSWDWNVTRNELVWSDEVYRMFGREPGSLTPTVDAFVQLIHPEDRDAVAEAIDRSVNGGEPYFTRFRMIRPDGDVIYIEARAEIRRDPRGRATRMTGTVLNITERVRIEEDLRESEQRFREMWNAIPDIVWLHDNGRVIAANQAAAEFSGASTPAELVGLDLMDVVVAEERERVRRHFESASEQPIEVRGLTPDGNVVHFETHARNVPYRGREVRIVAARDVTDRIETMQQLAESERRFRAMWNAVPDPVFIHDNGVIVEANDALADMVGVPRFELIGRDGFEMIHPDSQSALRERMNERSGVPIEVVAVSRTGEHRILEIRGRDLPYRGKTMRVVAVRDITEREHALRELGESEHRFRQLWDAVPEGVFIHDSGTIIEANRAFAQMVDYPMEQIIGTNAISLLVAEKDRARVIEIVQSGSEVPYEITGIRSDGTPFPVEISAKEVQFRGRQMRVAAVRDLTESRRAEEALRDSEARNRALINAIPDSLLRLRKDGTIIGFKPARESSPGLSGHELVGSRLDDLFEPETAATLRVLVQKSPIDSIVPSVEFTLPTVPPAHYEARVVAIDGEEAMAVLRNVTEQREAEIARAELAAQLRQSQKMEAVGTLAGGIAHDFNNLLVAIAGNAELLELEVPTQDNPAATLCLEEIRDACDRAGQLIRRLMFFSRRQVVQPRVIDINTVVDDMQRMLGRLIGENIRLRTSLSPEPLAVKVDPGHIEQVVVNLAVNARDAMPSGGELTVETRRIDWDWSDSGSRAALAPGHYAELCVTDTGIGMTSETLERIFEPFFTTKARGKGTGLGLSTVYGIVQQVGGDVRVSSTPGHGATFAVWFPISSEPLHSDDDVEIRRVDASAGAMILLVEDEDAVRDIVHRTLGRAGYRVQVASSGEEALRLVDSAGEPFDLLLTDVVMPGITGRELATRVTGRFPHIRTLYMSGYAEVPGDQQIPPALLLQKPFSSRDLEHRIHDLLRDRDRAHR